MFLKVKRDYQIDLYLFDNNYQYLKIIIYYIFFTISNISSINQFQETIYWFLNHISLASDIIIIN